MITSVTLVLPAVEWSLGDVNIKPTSVMMSDHSSFEVLAVQLNEPEPTLIVIVYRLAKSSDL